MQLGPGGSLACYTRNPTISSQDTDRRKIALGLDRFVTQQYCGWASGMLTGDWGHTFFGGGPVLTVILERVPATFILSGTALLFVRAVGALSGEPRASEKPKQSLSAGDHSAVQSDLRLTDDRLAGMRRRCPCHRDTSLQWPSNLNEMPVGHSC